MNVHLAGQEVDLPRECQKHSVKGDGYADRHEVSHQGRPARPAICELDSWDSSKYFCLQKACADRGLELSWSCAALENVGLPVHSSKNQMFSGGFSYCKAVFLNFGFMISFFPKAQRRRVFFFAVAQNFKLFQDQQNIFGSWHGLRT